MKPTIARGRLGGKQPGTWWLAAWADCADVSLCSQPTKIASVIPSSFQYPTFAVPGMPSGSPHLEGGSQQACQHLSHRRQAVV
jgi:hypothetical protein